MLFCQSLIPGFLSGVQHTFFSSTELLGSHGELWSDIHNKCGSPLSRIEGQILVDIINDHGFDQLFHFPTRERNTLDLIITSLPNQFVDIHSPDCLSDHDIVSGTLKIVIPPLRNLGGRCIGTRKVIMNL